VLLVQLSALSLLGRSEHGGHCPSVAVGFAHPDLLLSFFEDPEKIRLNLQRLRFFFGFLFLATCTDLVRDSAEE